MCSTLTSKYTYLVQRECKSDENYIDTGFAEVPSKETIELGRRELVEYRCRHTSSDALINWLVNGSSLGDFPDIRSESVSEDGNTVYILTIPAEPQYNGTEVVCVAFFLDGSPREMTPPVKLYYISEGM
jgi:hypothetical protein